LRIAGNREFDDFAPSAEHHFRRDEQQFISAFDRLALALTVFPLRHSMYMLRRVPLITQASGYPSAD